MEQQIMTQREQTNQEQRPAYEPPRMQQMSEREILNSFQITQSMGAWWTITSC